MEIPSKEDVERRVREASEAINGDPVVIDNRETISKMFQHAGQIVLPDVYPRDAAHAAGRAFHEYQEEYAIIDVRSRLRASLAAQDQLEKDLRLWKSNVSDLLRESGIFSEALEKLAKLGNGNKLGNSDGNEIAIAALKKAGYPCQSE